MTLDEYNREWILCMSRADDLEELAGWVSDAMQSEHWNGKLAKHACAMMAHLWKGTDMARSIGMAADATVFRAVITKKFPGREPFTSYEGPYGSAAAARARVTFWVNYLAVRDQDTDELTGESNASGYVEAGTVAWSRHPK